MVNTTGKRRVQTIERGKIFEKILYNRMNRCSKPLIRNTKSIRNKRGNMSNEQRLLKNIYDRQHLSENLLQLQYQDQFRGCLAGG